MEELQKYRPPSSTGSVSGSGIRASSRGRTGVGRGRGLVNGRGAGRDDYEDINARLAAQARAREQVDPHLVSGSGVRRSTSGESRSRSGSNSRRSSRKRGRESKKDSRRLTGLSLDRLSLKDDVVTGVTGHTKARKIDNVGTSSPLGVLINKIREMDLTRSSFQEEARRRVRVALDEVENHRDVVERMARDLERAEEHLTELTENVQQARRASPLRREEERVNREREEAARLEGERLRQERLAQEREERRRQEVAP